MLKRIFQNAHRYIFWAVFSAVIWTWILMLCTEVSPKRKVVVYADLEGLDKAALSEALSEDLPKGIRCVETERFTDQIFMPGSVQAGDLFLIPESAAESYAESFVPIDREAFPGASFLEWNGEAYGVCVYDPAAGISVAETFIRYPALLGEERCWLFFGKESLHIGSWNDASADDAAIVLAQAFMKLK